MRIVFQSIDRNNDMMLLQCFNLKLVKVRYVLEELKGMIECLSNLFLDTCA